MKEVKFEPSDCKGESAAFEGHVLFRMPTFVERMAYAAEVADINTENSKEKLELFVKLAPLAEKHVVGVAIKKKSDGAEFKSFEDLNCDDDCTSIMIEVCLLLVRGLASEKK